MTSDQGRTAAVGPGPHRGVEPGPHRGVEPGPHRGSRAGAVRVLPPACRRADTRNRTGSARFCAVEDLQAAVARAADQAGTHSTAPALLLQAAAALGKLAELANAATEGGRRPFRIPQGWQPELSELAHVVYLLADQTAVDVEAAVRSRAYQVSQAAADLRAQARDGEGWFSSAN